MEHLHAYLRYAYTGDKTFEIPATLVNGSLDGDDEVSVLPVTLVGDHWRADDAAYDIGEEHGQEAHDHFMSTLLTVIVPQLYASPRDHVVGFNLLGQHFAFALEIQK